MFSINNFNNDNKDKVKYNLDKILMYYGAIQQNKNGNWNCIPGRHGKNSKGDLSVKNIVCACHCGLQGDSFNVISEMERLDIVKDFYKIVNKGSEILNLPANAKNINRQFDKCNHKPNEIYHNEKINLTQIITDNYKKLNNNNAKYFLDRGFSLELINKYKILIANPTKIFDNDLLPYKEKTWAYEYIIPIWKNKKVVNCILRRNDLKSKRGKKTLNLTGIKVEFFNYDYLKKKNLKNLFICEGWADSLSFENEKLNSIGINSIVMINRLVNEIESKIDNFTNTKFYISFDQDEKGWGQKAAKNLLQKLKDLKLKCFNLNIKKPYKDINEYYVNDNKSFKKSVYYIIKRGDLTNGC